MKVKKAPAKETGKALALEAIREMPDDASLADIAEEIAILDGIEKGIKAADAGELIPHEEVKRQIEQWLTESNGPNRRKTNSRRSSA